MTMRDQLRQLQELFPRYECALRCAVVGEVTWLGPETITRIHGMPAKSVRLGSDLRS